LRKRNVVVGLVLMAALLAVASPVDASGAEVCTNVNGCSWAWYGPTYAGCQSVHGSVPVLGNVSVTACA
jgi:hypothetical protein